MITITTSELQSKFGQYIREARREPVTVTHDGTDSVVLLSTDEYERLKSLDDRKAYHAWELPDELLAALETVEIPAEGDRFNHEIR